jgi:ubiquinone/menaquinone biosynthesis C-methylase UbiE
LGGRIVTDRKADYSEIASVYDRARPSDSPHLEWWFEKIAEAGQLGPGKRLIDLGCGTGRWTIPLAERTGCEAVGVDNSPGMLAKAREKDSDGRVTWLEADVEYLDTVERESFDCALMSLIMHHVHDHLTTFRGVYRILRLGGVVLVRQGTLEQILNDVSHRFFPETVSIDLARTPLRSQVEGWLGRAGFEDVQAELVKQTSYPSNDRLLSALRLRVCSALRMISDEAFEAGLRRVEEYVEEHPDDESIRQDLFTLFSARKPDEH